MFKTSNKFWELFKKYRISPEELKSFTDAKTVNPLAQYGSKDYAYRGGVLAQTKTSHALLRKDTYIIYRIAGKDPTVVYLYGFTTHEDSGTGTPPKQGKQQTFSKQLDNMKFET